MQAYKAILLREFQQHGWDIQSVDSGGVGWWADEHWTIVSTRQNWGMTLIISFLVDPQWVGNRKKGQGVWAVGVTPTLPTDRLAAEESIAELLRVHGPFAENAAAFIQSIDNYRQSLAASASD